MFDPTVYENLKVVLEGAVYDLDLAGTIRVTSRMDRMDLAAMSRTYKVGFRLASGDDAEDANIASVPSTEMVLSTELADLASEILELPGVTPGCSLDVRFTMELPHGAAAESVCPMIEAALRKVWGGRFAIRQILSWEYGPEPAILRNRIHILFGRRFGEEVAEDFSRIVDHTVFSLEELSRLTDAIRPNK